MASSSQNNKPSIWAKIIAIIIVAAPLYLVYLLLRFMWHIGVAITHFTPQDWSTLGDVARNSSGWVALLAAIGTIGVMMKTNNSREKEAASSNFRDHLQWAVERATDDRNQFEVAFAQAVIQHFANNKPKHLSEEEHQLVLEIRETLEKMQVIEDLPSPKNSQ